MPLKVRNNIYIMLNKVGKRRNKRKEKGVLNARSQTLGHKGNLKYPVIKGILNARSQLSGLTRSGITQRTDRTKNEFAETVYTLIERSLHEKHKTLAISGSYDDASGPPTRPKYRKSTAKSTSKGRKTCGERNSLHVPPFFPIFASTRIRFN